MSIKVDKFVKTVLFIVVVGIVLFVLSDAQATSYRKQPVAEQEQKQTSKNYNKNRNYADANSKSVSDSNATANSESASNASSSNEGNSLEVNTTNEAGPGDLVLVPNNNTESCLRVFGLAWGNKDASGMLGIPWRSKPCDYEQAADDAFAAGERELGWFWKCQNPNLYKRFRDKGESQEKAAEDCLIRMVGPITLQRQLKAAEDQLAFIENERRIERENAIVERNRIQEDCAETNERVLEACVSK